MARLQHTSMAACAAVAEDGGVELVIVPDGYTKNGNGVEWTIDNAAWNRVDEWFREHGVSIPVDLLHETTNAACDPKTALGAIGWVESMRYEKGRGIIGKIVWNQEGKDRVRSDRFRYLSPTLWMDKDGKVLGIHSIGLVNKPAIAGMRRVAAMEDPEKGGAAENGKILPIKNDGSLPSSTENNLVACAVREALGLPGNANKDAVLLALSMRAELKDSRQRDEDRQCNERVEKFVKANKLNPNDKLAMEACRQLARTQPDMLEAIFCNAMPYIQPGRTSPPGESDAKSVQREKAIQSAKNDFSAYPQLSKLTSVAAYVSNRLRESGHAVLTNKELETLMG